MVWKTKADFRKSLRDSYRDAGLKKHVRSGRSLGSVIWDSRESTKIKVLKSTSAGLAIIDDLLSDAIIWFFSFYMILMRDVFDKSRGGKGPPLELSIIALSMKITQDAVVIRDLIATGYDLQARNLVRSVGEHVDALYYLCLHPDACAEFVNTEDEVSSNRFWYEHLRRAQVATDKKISELLKENLSEKFSDFRREEGKTFSAAHHPSYWACMNSQFTPSSRDMAFNLFGVPSEFSFRTGKFLFYNLAECAIVLPIICAPIAAFISKLNSDHPFNEFVKRGIPHLIVMLLALIENWNAPVFEFSDEFDEFLKSLSEKE